MQRWPAVPTAANAIARTASSRSARRRHDHRVVAAQLEQAAAQPRGDAGRQGAAHRRRPGGRDERHARVVGELLGALVAADDDLEQAVRDAADALARRDAAATGRRAPSAACCGDGFQITESPQTSASAVFQLQTATGKLNAVMTPTGPSGCHCLEHAVPGPLGGDGETVELAREADARGRRCRSSPAPRRAPSDTILPVSSVTSAPRSSFVRAQLLAPAGAPARRGAGAGTSRHTSNAASARLIAASVSAADDEAMRAITSPVIGVRTSWSPDCSAAASSPSREKIAAVSMGGSCHGPMHYRHAPCVRRR